MRFDLLTSPLYKQWSSQPRRRAQILEATLHQRATSCSHSLFCRHSNSPGRSRYYITRERSSRTPRRTTRFCHPVCVANTAPHFANLAASSNCNTTSSLPLSALEYTFSSRLQLTWHSLSPLPLHPALFCIHAVSLAPNWSHNDLYGELYNHFVLIFGRLTKKCCFVNLISLKV